VRFLHLHKARSFLEEQERRLLRAYASYSKQRRKKKRAQKKERIKKQVRRLLGQHP
jgi:hypothetical protein